MNKIKTLEHELLLSLLEKIEKAITEIKNPFTTNLYLYKKHIELITQTTQLLSQSIIITSVPLTEYPNYNSLKNQVDLISSLLN